MADERAVAFHEAGHAVVGFWSFRRFRYVTIDPSEGALGHVQTWKLGKRFNPEIELTPAARRIIDREVSMLYAGTIAEKRVTKRWNHAGAEDDRLTAVDLASYVAPHPVELAAYLKWRFVAAKLQLENRWADVERLAAALLRQRRLTLNEVRHVILETDK